MSSSLNFGAHFAREDQPLCIDFTHVLWPTQKCVDQILSENSKTVVTSVHLLVFAHHPVGVVAFRASSSAKQREFENNWSGL
jgi:hypothetical protein